MGTQAEMQQNEKQPPRGSFAFTGTAWGYYKVYIVNVLLTILTLGIYSAWAKVRTRRYFFGNTWLGGHNFDFDAQPKTILVSRVAIVALLLLLSFLDTSLNLIVAGIGVFSTLVLLLMPFAVVRGRSFNSRHTLHRSVRFRYQILYLPTVRMYCFYLCIYLAIFMLVTLSSDIWPGFGSVEGAVEYAYAMILLIILLIPYALHARHGVQINQLSFGRLRCQYSASLSSYWRKYMSALAAGLVVSIAQMPFYGINPYVFLPGLFVTFWVFGSQLIPVYWSSIKLSDGSELRSSATAFSYFWAIMVLNLLLLIISFGILYPLTVVRKWNYLVKHTQIDYSQEHAEIAMSSDEELSPIAEEFSDVSGADFDFGAI